MERKRMLKILMGVMVIVIVTLSCSMPSGQTKPTDTPAAEGSTEVGDAPTEEGASPTDTETVPSDTPEPTFTPTETTQPTETHTPQPPTPTYTNTPIPCNMARFVADVTIPDNTEIVTGENFIKTWRLKNVGSCTWTGAYDLVYYSGDQMDAPAAVDFPAVNVPPDGTVDISVSLKAPDSAGTYQGYFRLRAPDNAVFGIGTDGQGSFWVKIKAVDPTPVPAPSGPDLKITEFTLDPPVPTQGQPVHVRVGVYNQGDTLAGPFSVKWYGLSTAANPSCEWNEPNMVAHGGRILECDYTFASWYPHDKISIVYADYDNQVAETDETNNTAQINGFGVDKP